MRDLMHLTAGGQPKQFEFMFSELCREWLAQETFDRGEVHAQKVTDPAMATRELRDVILDVRVPTEAEYWQQVVSPNLPWAEDHFQERVSGEPLNPPPAEAWWPYAQQGNSAHKEGEKFSHTYPERFWPKMANVDGRSMDSAYPNRVIAVPHMGIRFTYGDLLDLVIVLMNNPRSRQAYLPVWFPEDLTAASQGKRVPCTLGYHFMLHPDGNLHMTYHMRSCDLVRFLRDDIYMAGRLLQWVVGELHFAGHHTLGVGGMRLTLSSLHAFQGDGVWITQQAAKAAPDKRSTYNLDALG